ncbi:MAG: cytochrome c [Rhodobacteraceae bacterium]|nr:cytochrome c [Paracoccaceae bacterium]
MAGNWGWTIGGVLAVGVGVAVWNLAGAPAPGPGHSMVPPDTSAIPEGAPIVEVALPDTLPEGAALGRQVFNGVCATCHGENAAGRNGIAPPLVHRIYEPGHHGDAAFVIAARSGVRAHHWRFGDMPPVETPISDGEMRALVTYIRALQRANGIL